MFLFRERLRQKYRTLNWPKQEPVLSPLYKGRPLLRKVLCGNCSRCMDICPVSALDRDNGRLRLDMGRCIFCGECARICPEQAIIFSGDYRLASRSRADLFVHVRDNISPGEAVRRLPDRSGIFGKSFKLRQVSAGGCNACEADCNVLGTLVYDLGRFGVEFTASPRHADAIVLTGPVTRNMFPALMDAWQAVPKPAVVVAVGACAISGGLFTHCNDCLGGMDGCAELPAALEADFRAAVYIPGCPPNPWTILEGLLMARELGS